MAGWNILCVCDGGSAGEVAEGFEEGGAGHGHIKAHESVARGSKHAAVVERKAVVLEPLA